MSTLPNSLILPNIILTLLSSGRSLEEIDTMFLFEVKPWNSSKWSAPEGEELASADRRRISQGGRRASKALDARAGSYAQTENVGSTRSMPQTNGGRDSAV